MKRQPTGLVLVIAAVFGAQAENARAEGRRTLPASLHVSQKALQGIDADSQVRSIGEAAGRVEPGDTVLIHAGVYRETVTVEKSGTRDKPVTFAAVFGERVIVTGADRITQWRREDPTRHVYSAPWPHSFINWNQRHAHPNDDRHLVIGRCEQVFVNNYLLRQVLTRGELSRGTFYVDLGAKRLYVWTADDGDLTKKGRHRVEASSRGLVWRSKGDYVHVRGIRFRYAANMAQRGAVIVEGNHCVLEDCVSEDMNSIGATFIEGRNIVVRRCTFQRNGQMGFGACLAHGLLFTGCTVRNNNVKNWNRGWEAGADKIVLCRGAVLEDSRFIENRGNGVWFDIGNEDCTVRNCLIADNEGTGIFYEISYGLHAHDNVIVGNGFDSGSGAWGASGGISLSSSPDCVVERNLIVGNKEGFQYREQHRDTPRIGPDGKKAPGGVPVWNHDQIVRQNVLAYNRDAQAWGWFDVHDGRHWPAAMRPKLPAQEGRSPEDIAEEYLAKDHKGQPADLTLERLRLAHTENLFFPAPGQGLFNWGTTWLYHKRYSDLDEVRDELSLERGSRVADPGFVDYLTRDFRVPPTSPARRMGCYPRGEVPGVTLGVVR